MKTIVICCLWFMGCSLTLAERPPDPRKSGSHSHLLSHSIVFKAGGNGQEPGFVATLTNVSRKKLTILVNDKKFHSTLQIKDRSGKKEEIFEKQYRNLVLTSEWSEPQIEMAPNQSITWVVPLSSLLTLHGKAVTHEFLMGCTVVSDMNAAVVPPHGNYVANNARQESRPILIPDKD